MAESSSTRQSQIVQVKRGVHGADAEPSRYTRAGLLEKRTREVDNGCERVLALPHKRRLRDNTPSGIISE